MLIGFNTDFTYKGVVYHVQTEDNGVNNPVIVTLLYMGGTILASRKVSYADILRFEKLDKVVRELMEEQHKQIIKDMVAGKFAKPGDHLAQKPVPVSEVKANEVTAKAEASKDADTSEAEIIEILQVEEPSSPSIPVSVAPPKKKPMTMDDIILDYMVQEELKNNS